ncbi:unnamed protein product, partial [Effrenium voratum]
TWIAATSSTVRWIASGVRGMTGVDARLPVTAALASEGSPSRSRTTALESHATRAKAFKSRIVTLSRAAVIAGGRIGAPGELALQAAPEG